MSFQPVFDNKHIEMFLFFLNDNFYIYLHPCFNFLGTKWLIDEHRKCIAELKRLKIMIADLAKYISVLREKGHQLFNSYLALKKHLDQLKIQLEDYHTKEKGQQGRIEKLRAEMEEWKGKARELQHALDDLKHRYHDLEKEHKVR